MDIQSILLYASLPIFSTLFSLISKASLSQIDAKSYTAGVLLISAILSHAYNNIVGIKTGINYLSIIAGCAFGIATLLFEEALHIAANPGLVNAIYRSQAALTAIVSVFILGSHLSYISMAGILMTVAGAALLGIYKARHKEGYEPYIVEQTKENNKNDQHKHGHGKHLWIPLVIIAGILSTVKDITGVLSIRDNKMPPSSFVFSQCFFGAMMVYIYQYFTKGTLMPKIIDGGDKWQALSGIGAAAVDNFIWCGVLIFLMNAARNPAYPKAVTMLGIPLTSLLSPYFFGTKGLDSIQWSGVLSVVLGIAMIAYK